jgi:hypothetical protein
LLEEAFDFPAQIPRSILHSLGSGEHFLGGAAARVGNIRIGIAFERVRPPAVVLTLTGG